MHLLLHAKLQCWRENTITFVFFGSLSSCNIALSYVEMSTRQVLESPASRKVKRIISYVGGAILWTITEHEDTKT